MHTIVDTRPDVGDFVQLSIVNEKERIARERARHQAKGPGGRMSDLRSGHLDISDLV